MPSEPAIVVSDLHKAFFVRDRRIGSLKTLMLWGKGRPEHERVNVLNGIDLTVQKGEAVGLIGRNGAGKSTLLMLIARIYTPTKGSVQVAGRVAPLLELGAGFHPDLTGRDNIVFNGMLLGFTKEQIEAKMAEIVDFADIGKYIDRPSRTYSSGMQARLGFAVAIHTEPDVLIVDEALSVGDIGFVAKCQEKVAEFRKKGGTLLLVSHAVDLMMKSADRLVWLEQGRIYDQGTPTAVLRRYKNFMSAAEMREENQEPERAHEGPPKVFPLPVSGQDAPVVPGTPEPLLWMRIPGLADPVFDEVRSRMPEAEVALVNNYPAENRYTKFIQSPLEPDVRLVVGSFPFGLHRILGLKPKYLLMMRDPITMAWAMYQRQKHPNAIFTVEANKLPIVKFYEAGLSPIFENPMTKLLAGTIFQHRFWHEPHRPSDNDLVEAALANIRSGEVKVVLEEEPGEAIERLYADLKIGSPELPGYTPTTAELTPQVLKGLVPYFALDIKIYNAVKSVGLEEPKRKDDPAYHL